MELKTYLLILWRRWLIVCATTLVGFILAVVAIISMNPTYDASATLRVAKSSAGYENLAYTERLMQTYASIITGRNVKSELNQRLGLNETPVVNMEFPANTELMEINVTHEDPEMAAAIANTLADILISQSRVTRGERDYTVDLIIPAVASDTPSAPHNALIIVLGIMVGLGGGVVFAFLAENLDSSLYTRNQIEQASGLLTLAEVPATRSAKRNVFVNGNSVDGEAFRQLRTKLFVIERESNLKTLLVTSAEPHEGKSTIIANLALTLAHAGRKVVVIDGDMRRPRQHMIFGLENKQGLSDVLQQQAELDEVLQVTTIEGIQVLTSGALRDYPGELVIMPQMREIIIQLREHADVVLIDAPAVLAVADASVLATLVDGVLLVVEQSRSREDAVQEARRRLDHLNVRTLGVVMNRSDVHTRYQYYQSK